MTAERKAPIPPEQWWKTSIIDIKPGEIGIRGYPIEQLIGKLSYAQMVWLMLRGEVPTDAQGALLEAALVAAVDHGPQAPSIAVARMSVTCGIDINNAMASAVNVLGDVHGGAGQQCMELYQAIAEKPTQQPEDGITLEGQVRAAIDAYQADVSKIVPGFGHRFHQRDPRSIKLLSLLDEARAAGVVEGRFLDIARAVEVELGRRKGKPLPMNIDGATAAIYCELGFPPELGRGMFILSRSVGILAHAYEQSLSSERIKGPMPPSVPYTYTGAPRRDF
jgi:citrate synthase